MGSSTANHDLAVTRIKCCPMHQSPASSFYQPIQPALRKYDLPILNATERWVVKTPSKCFLFVVVYFFKGPPLSNQFLWAVSQMDI